MHHLYPSARLQSLVFVFELIPLQALNPIIRNDVSNDFTDPEALPKGLRQDSVDEAEA